MIRIIFNILTGLATLVTPELSIAEDIEWRQGNNARILPQYCQDYLRPERWEKWRDYFGPVFIHMHHYCGGIYAEIKAKATTDKRRRDGWLGETVNQMRYVAPYCDPTCVLYLDLHKRWAWALSAQGNATEAMKHIELMKAARPNAAKPKAPPATS